MWRACSVLHHTTQVLQFSGSESRPGTSLGRPGWRQRPEGVGRRSEGPALTLPNTEVISKLSRELIPILLISQTHTPAIHKHKQREQAVKHSRRRGWLHTGSYLDEVKFSWKLKGNSTLVPSLAVSECWWGVFFLLKGYQRSHTADSLIVNIYSFLKHPI